MYLKFTMYVFYLVSKSVLYTLSVFFWGANGFVNAPSCPVRAGGHRGALLAALPGGAVVQDLVPVSGPALGRRWNGVR